MPEQHPTRPRPRPRRGSWRVALRYASRDVRRHKGRTALVAAMVALPVLLGSFVVTDLAGSTGRVTADQALGTDHTVQARVSLVSVGSAEQGPFLVGYGNGPQDRTVFPTSDGSTEASKAKPVPIADYEAKLASVLPAGDTLRRVVGGDVSVRTPGGMVRTGASAQQSDLADPVLAEQVSLTDGRLPRAAGEVALDDDLARQLGVRTGDQVSVALQSPDGDVVWRFEDGTLSGEPSADPGSERQYVVTGITSRAQASILFGPDGPLDPAPVLDWWLDTDDSVFAWPPDISWLVVGPAPVTWGEVPAVNALGSVVLSRDVLDHPPAHADALEAASGGTSSASVTYQSAALVGGAVALGLLQAVLMIGPAFTVGARRSARDLALLGANGADAATIRRTVLAGGLVVGLVTSVGAAALGAAAATVALRSGWMWGYPPPVQWRWLAAFVAVGTLIAVAAAWVPARRAARLDPALVLAGRRADPPVSRWPGIVGGVLAGVGAATALTGAATRQSIVVLVVGVAVAEAGLVLASGAVVGIVAHLARWLGASPRLALRDAARHRGRTGPAIAAVLAATAAAVAGLTFSASRTQHDALSYEPVAATSTLLAGPLGGDVRGLSPAAVRTIEDTLADARLVDGPMQVVSAVRSVAPDGTATQVYLTYRPGVFLPDGYANGSAPIGTVVDDGSLVRLLGVPDPDRAARALRDGKAVVPAPYVLPDGTAELSISDGGTDARTVRVPAVGVGDDLTPRTNLPVLPPSLARSLGLEVVPGAVVGHSRPGSWNTAVRDTVDDRLDAALPVTRATTDSARAGGAVVVGTAGGTPVGPGDDGMPVASMAVYVEPGHEVPVPSSSDVEHYITLAALVVALAAAWIATALAGTESLPDLATLQAVGAPPRTRRRFAAAQSAVVTVTGSVLGAATGLVIGATVVLSQREQLAATDPRWMVDVPWGYVAALVVAVPVLGALAAALVTRSRLPLSRRVDG